MSDPHSTRINTVSDRHYYKRHKEDDYIDEVRIVTRERYKTSGLSGDEWRFSKVMQFYRKGVLLYESPYNGTMQSVAGYLAWALVDAGESGQLAPFDDGALCFQPGCPEPAVSEYELIEEFSRQGEKLDPSERPSWAYRRKFCRKHLRRGDCGREDADRNYRVAAGPGPDGADMRGATISESAQVTMQVGSLDDIPGAVQDTVRRLHAPEN